MGIRVAGSERCYIAGIITECHLVPVPDNSELKNIKLKVSER